MNIADLASLVGAADEHEIKGIFLNGTERVIRCTSEGIWDCWLYTTGDVEADEWWQAESLDELVSIGQQHKHVNVLEMRTR